MLLRQSVKDQVHDIIKDKILRGEYSLGSAINIAQLSSELGVSNTPIREALSRLETEGIVIKIGARHQVVSFSDESNADLDEAVSILVIGGFDICIKRGKLEPLAKGLREAYTKQLETEHGDAYDYLCATIDFDRTIVRQSGNRLLEDHFDEVSVLLSLAVLNKHQENTETNLREHREILEAVERGDVAAARSLLLAHYDKPLSDYPAR